MSSAATVVNIGLTALGDPTLIVTLDDNTKTANLAKKIYDPLRKAELRAHPWNFARKRVKVAKDATNPAFGYSYRYLKPADFVRLVTTEDQTDFQIEGDYILSDDSSPIELIYISNVTDVSKFDPLFMQALGLRLAIDLSPHLTNSGTKRERLKEDYRDVVSEARRTNAIENIPAERPEDTWISVRR